MRFCRHALFLPAAIALAGLPGGAIAHEYWLAPTPYRGAAGDTVAIAAYVGTGFRGERLTFPAERVVRLVVRGGGGARDLAHEGEDGDSTFARFALPDDGGVVVAYESNFATIEMSGPEFEEYLALEGLDAPRAARARAGERARPARERYRRCAKTWIAGEDETRQRDRLTRPLGLPLELVPLADPAAGDLLRVRLLRDGRPLAGALVRAWRGSHAVVAGLHAAAVRDSVGPAAEARTDGEGIAALRLGKAGADRPGEWLVSAVHMVASREPGEADWESTWASLTFAR